MSTTAVVSRRLVPKIRKQQPSVQDIIQHASAEEKQSWFDANSAATAPIAGTVEGEMQNIIPAMYSAFGAYGWQQAITWYQLSQMYVSWEYTATEKIARTLAALPAKLFRYENSQGKNVKPYYAKSLMFNDLSKQMHPVAAAHKMKKDHGVKRIEIDDHPFLDLVNEPSQDMVRYNFWRMLCIHLELMVLVVSTKPSRICLDIPLSFIFSQRRGQGNSNPYLLMMVYPSFVLIVCWIKTSTLSLRKKKSFGHIIHH